MTTLCLAGCSDSDEQSEGNEPQAEASDTDAETEEGERENGEETLVVEPEDSIQDAIDESEPGGTVEVRPATYGEAVTVDKELTLVAPDGAFLDGIAAGGEAGFTVAASGVRIEGFEIVDYATGGIVTETDVAEITVTDVVLSNNSGFPLDLSGDIVSLEGVALEDNGGPARIESSSDGNVTVTDGTFVRSDEGGLSVTSGKSIVLERVEALQNGATGVLVEGGDVRGQTVEVTDSTVIENTGGSGLSIAGTRGDDAVTVANLEATDNSDHGIEIAAETVTVSGVDLRKNGATTSGLSIESSGDGSVTISDSTIEQTERNTGWSSSDYGRGVHVVGGETVEVENVDLLQNGGHQLLVEGGDARGQTVSVRDSSIVENSSGSGLEITGTRGDDTVTVANVEAVDNSNHGIEIVAETVEVSGVDLRENGATTSGLSIESSSDGSVTISDSVVEQTVRNTGWFNSEYGRGVHVVGGETVEVENVDLLQNGGHQLLVEGGDVRGQTVSVSDSTITGSTDGSGVVAQDTGGDDEHTITNVTADDNSSYGFSLGAETVTIEDTSAEGNGSGPLELLTIDESEATIRNSF
ncbi:right-handed parallel beta-helix repeat-containing protein [Halosolutus amylolyticus]|uniref:Right-handed parallel beta-helix repeat-containing protein n=1 Tax=Halosolutus amylolyticus TaxID=2932267 RepID=A0ABD5PJG8_9EURY|nr:right-handed parallel beta-helix repeat-containing protein [Halosolutus amylolyticus]